MMIIYLYTGCAWCLPLKNLSIEFTRLNRFQFVQIICPEFVFCELLLLWLEELWVRLTDWHDDGGQVDLIADWPTNNNYWPLRSAAVALTESEGTCKILAVKRQPFANNKVMENNSDWWWCGDLISLRLCKSAELFVCLEVKHWRETSSHPLNVVHVVDPFQSHSEVRLGIIPVEDLLSAGRVASLEVIVVVAVPWDTWSRPRPQWSTCER